DPDEPRAQVAAEDVAQDVGGDEVFAVELDLVERPHPALGDGLEGREIVVALPDLELLDGEAPRGGVRLRRVVPEGIHELSRAWSHPARRPDLEYITSPEPSDRGSSLREARRSRA